MTARDLGILDLATAGRTALHDSSPVLVAGCRGGPEATGAAGRCRREAKGQARDDRGGDDRGLEVSPDVEHDVLPDAVHAPMVAQLGARIVSSPGAALPAPPRAAPLRAGRAYRVPERRK